MKIQTKEIFKIFWFNVMMWSITVVVVSLIIFGINKLLQFNEILGLTVLGLLFISVLLSFVWDSAEKEYIKKQSNKTINNKEKGK